MNYCRKCQSDYDRPGTCNCFAERVEVKKPSEETLERIRRMTEQVPSVLGGCPVARAGGGVCYCTGACRSQSTAVRPLVTYINT